MEKPAVLIHISDLHFIGFLQNTEDGFPNPHTFSLARPLAAIVNSYYSECGDNRMIVVITGDLTTNADESSYEEVHNYIRGSKHIDRYREAGLNLGQNVFVVPGNHDAWFRLWWRKYSDRKILYYKYFPLCPDYEIKRIGNIDFVFYFIDSNEVTGISNIFNLNNVIGKGEIGEDQFNDISSYYDEFKSHKIRKKIPPGFTYEKSIKVALLHHHLVPPKKDEKTPGKGILALRDSREAITVFQNIGINFVLCGHQHSPYHEFISEDKPTIFFSCAGSATQLHGKVNSFKVYEFYSDHFDMIQYEADQKVNQFAFKKLAPQTFSYPDGFKPDIH